MDKLMVAKRQDVIEALLKNNSNGAAEKIKKWDGERVIIKTEDSATLFMESPKLFNYEETRTVLLVDAEEIPDE